MRLDEILEALPEVGLRLWMLDQCEELQGDKYVPVWHAAVYVPEQGLRGRQEAHGATPCEAMCAALKLAGVDVSSD